MRIREIRPARGLNFQLKFTTGPRRFSRISSGCPGETLVIADGKIVERRHRPALLQGGPSRSHTRMPPFSLMRSCATASPTIFALMCPTACSSRWYRFFNPGRVDGAVRDQSGVRAHGGISGSHVTDESRRGAGRTRGWRRSSCGNDSGISGTPRRASPTHSTIPPPTRRLFPPSRCRGRPGRVKVVLSGEGGDDVLRVQPNRRARRLAASSPGSAPAANST